MRIKTFSQLLLYQIYSRKAAFCDCAVQFIHALITGMEKRLSDEEETKAFAASFSARLKPGDTVALRGDLGSGKSVFARSALRALCQNDMLEVPSPTFTLVQHYDSPAGPLYHFDLYRISESSELSELGWDEALKEGICFIEWPERAESSFPDRYHDITLSIPEDDGEARIITVETVS